MTHPWFTTLCGLADSSRYEPRKVYWAQLRLSGHAEAALPRSGINSIAELTALTDAQLLKLPGIGKTHYWAIVDALAALGLTLKD